MQKYFTVKKGSLDISKEVKDFGTQAVDFAVQDIENFTVSYEKPFNQFYMEFDELNITDLTYTAEYWDGTAWVALDILDETNGALNSGFITFDKPEAWAKDSDDLYALRFTPSFSFSEGTTLKGLAILFSNDLDLEGIKSNIVSKLNNGKSWVQKHEAARKYIIQKLRNLGHKTITIGNTTIAYNDLTEFDLLEPFELREASKFYALSYIYLDELSDEIDDKYERAGRRHLQRADEAVELYMLKIDKDNDGVEDSDESEGSTRIDLVWE